MRGCWLTVGLLVCALSGSAPAGQFCVDDRVIVLPFGVITDEDPVTLEIHIDTFSAPAVLLEPTEVTVEGNDVFVELYADDLGELGSPASIIENVQLGTLDAGTYAFEIHQNAADGCSEQTITGSFCVEPVGCGSDVCRCPVFSPAYEIMALGTLGGLSSIALAVNDKGQVCGGADRSDGTRHAFLWTDGKMTDLGTLPLWTQSEAWDLNNVGQVVGISTNTGSLSSAFLWENGKLIDLGHLTGQPTGDTSAFGINDAGQVAGVSRVSPTEGHAFRWEDGVLQDIPNGMGGLSAGALDINNAGQIVGGGDTDGSPGGAFVWTDGDMKNLGTLGGELSWAQAINSTGAIVGSSERPAGNRVFHAFLWDDGEMVDLGALGNFPSSKAEAINDRGQVVGGPSFLYKPNEGFQELRDLLPVDSGWTDLRPRDINDAGQIVGDGVFEGRLQAFLMTPLPEPPPPPPPPVPAASEWGAAMMLILLLVTGTIVIFRRARFSRE